MIDKIDRIINELNLGIDCINSFKEKWGWKVIGFEIPIYNSVSLLKELREECEQK